MRGRGTWALSETGRGGEREGRVSEALTEAGRGRRRSGEIGRSLWGRERHRETRERHREVGRGKGEELRPFRR